MIFWRGKAFLRTHQGQVEHLIRHFERMLRGYSSRSEINDEARCGFGEKKLRLWHDEQKLDTTIEPQSVPSVGDTVHRHLSLIVICRADF